MNARWMICLILSSAWASSLVSRADTLPCPVPDTLNVQTGSDDLRTLQTKVSDLASAVPLFEKFVRSHTREFSRDVVSYHYDDASKRALKGSAADRARKDAQSFGDAQESYSDYSPGYYVAIDPVSSREWGGTNPVLAIVSLPKGTRFLDFRDRIHDPEQLNELKAVGCIRPVPPGANPDDDYYRNMGITELRTSSSLKCRETFIQVLKKYNVQAIEYGFPAPQNLGNCSRNINQLVALIIIDPKLVSKLNVALAKSSGSASETDACSNRLYQDGISAPIMARLPAQKKVSPWLDSSSDCSDYASWEHDHIFGCGGFPEDQ